jgi:hypothetical protein
MTIRSPITCVTFAINIAFAVPSKPNSGVSQMQSSVMIPVIIVNNGTCILKCLVAITTKPSIPAT